MIESLHLRNFQTHKKQVLELDPRVTTITGPSDVGKSTLIRALRWVCLNQPQGTDFIRWGSKEAEVEVVVDGHSVVRTRGKENSYELDGGELKAFGGGKVPDSISNLLNVTDLNFQMQLDGPFWFDLSPPQVSRELNQVIDLSAIDDSLDNAAAAVREAQAREKVSQQRLEVAKEKQAELEWVRRASIKFTELEYLESKAIELAAETGDIKRSVQQVSQHQTTIKQAKQGMRGAEEMESSVTTLHELNKTASKLRQDKKELESEINKLEKLG